MVLGEIGQPGDRPVAADINDFFQNYSFASATYVEDILPNPNNDVSTNTNDEEEMEADVELESVGAPKAATITLVEPPAGELFTTGSNEIANNFPTAASVSTSYGRCEQYLAANEQQAVQQAVQQGNTEGQTWFALTGDDGSDDCTTLANPPIASIHFPASIPEVTAVGGTTPMSPFDPTGDVTAYTSEEVWNTCGQVSGPGLFAGAGGGGPSALFSKLFVAADLEPCGWRA